MRKMVNNLSWYLISAIFYFIFKFSSASSEEKVEEWHPLLPVEKKLIAYSLVLAVILLIFLIWISYTYFGVR